MDFVIIYIIIAVFLSILTRRIFFLVFAVLSIFILIALALNLYFCYMTAGLLLSKRRKGRFIRVEEEREDTQLFGENIVFKVAVYEVDGTEYRSVFPAEGLFDIFFYRSKKMCTLWLNKKHGKVFDVYNVMSCIAWPVFSAAFCAGLVYVLTVVYRLGL